MTFTRTVHSMAMPFEVTIDGVDEETAQHAIDAFHAVLVDADETFSPWLPHSTVSRIGRRELSPLDAPAEVREVLDLCERFRDATNGAFDARRADGIVDPTGIVKMWAVDRAAVHLDAVSHSWMVGASGDVLVRGEPRRIGIANPRVTGDPAGTPVLDVVAVGAARRALATSGGAQVADHIWDPVTGEVARHYMQVSVVADDAVTADAWATAVCAGGPPTAVLAVEAGLDVLLIVGGRHDGTFDARSSAGWPSVLA
jgi:thiamine biosynthesis lipoprotein